MISTFFGKRESDLTNGYTGQISAVIFFAKISTKAAIKNLLGEPSVNCTRRVHWQN